MILLVIGNVLFASIALWALSRERVAEQKLSGQAVNAKVLDFARLFIDKVLRGDKEVSFDDRLLLENLVRDINDKEIFTAWQTFTKAKTQDEVQSDFYSLFDLLFKKILR